VLFLQLGVLEREGGRKGGRRKGRGEEREGGKCEFPLLPVGTRAGGRDGRKEGRRGRKRKHLDVVLGGVFGRDLLKALLEEIAGTLELAARVPEAGGEREGGRGGGREVGGV